MAVDYEAVKNVSVISTGSAAMHREHMYGSRKPALWWVAGGKESIADVPLNVFVIEHGDGLVLVDTGMDPAAATDPDDGLRPQLVQAGYRPDDVKSAVHSHLHFDHVGSVRGCDS